MVGDSLRAEKYAGLKSTRLRAGFPLSRREWKLTYSIGDVGRTRVSGWARVYWKRPPTQTDHGSWLEHSFRDRARRSKKEALI